MGGRVIKQEELFQERILKVVKEYKKLYDLYWWKYKILEDYIKTLEDRLHEEDEEFDKIGELKKLEEELLKARYYKLE